MVPAAPGVVPEQEDPEDPQDAAGSRRAADSEDAGDPAADRADLEAVVSAGGEVPVVPADVSRVRARADRAAPGKWAA
jgi:hypothetical protein